MSSFSPEPPDSIQIPQDQGAPPADDSGGDPVQLLKDAIAKLTQFQQVEPDAVDKSVAAKVLAQLHTLLAKEQTDQDSSTTGALNPRLLRKAGVIGGV